ncbi:pro-neuregulin-3, membrane-bound isoform isoform X2 [Lingula anatina]|uniref:Pro-neuregulin-3, membrane-bound isoform isoform X2 n=1 Tax=Lingula anatina TaxID=7574 RepID=A0A1S3H494_LINAN|nr:pro-neuregulin-3, membrane-bound isoform isoform X2 [Lingula anatina]XP_013379960.1 pro-neuregulin-3, membrane-bound isoform isoform X2 [Lingula anatina]XP_013379961.1 pro-neuregulin-3, membrane-bound isoform isoform X2 [Lingula anatina]XP_013379962.1 pro-neuregulin-3, membrane-bound isoform isoform X2 [Lingula anatina]XP_013379963.1 pro-neuregulin-3, membrane-bound isoform isoform X2 [Lingula anatina]XP_013379964.1 pro-neuregulin-3, membrane-bound isoform isoform X2 [Lingula anatina]XP_01|eukprot:XP_013379959.1 pro-neuregulin-3, membrane-bound isoform isoform X2 [Lingula anatina]
MKPIKMVYINQPVVAFGFVLCSALLSLTDACGRKAAVYTTDAPSQVVAPTQHPPAASTPADHKLPCTHDEVFKAKCLNAGQCVALQISASNREVTCHCKRGYSGTRCEYLMRPVQDPMMANVAAGIGVAVFVVVIIIVAVVAYIVIRKRNSRQRTINLNADTEDEVGRPFSRRASVIASDTKRARPVYADPDKHEALPTANGHQEEKLLKNDLERDCEKGEAEDKV